MALPAYIDASTGAITDGEAWVGIATTTLGSDTATVTFTSTDDGQVGDWSQYMDLVLVIYARTAGAGSTDREMNMQLNNDTGTNYDAQKLRGYGSGVTASKSSGAVRFNIGQNPSTNATANIFGATITTLFDINSGKYKSGLSQTACDLDGSGAVELWGLTWKSQAPITEIDLYDLYGSNLLTGSSFSLFGVLPRMVA
jgi:hypothetical protein